MNILMAGGTGLIGNKLRSSAIFKDAFWKILTRKPNKYYAESHKNETFISLEDFYRNPMDFLKDIDLVINLAGQSIASFPWTKSKKETILNSRTVITETIVNGIYQLNNPDVVLLNASAVGYYGLQEDTSVVLDESSAPLQSPPGFISHVCQQWEAATLPLHQAANRVINLRFGMVLSPEGGIQKKLELPIKLWLAGPLGSGLQPVAWIALDEIPHIIRFLIDQKSIQGPVNIVAPEVVIQKEFIKSIAQIYNRKAIIPTPALIIRLFMGEFGNELLLHGQAIRPQKLQDAGYSFMFPTLDKYIQSIRL
ncbi:MAG: TIGR01777 family oxidoreductase [Calditrichia bacterium]